MSIDAIAYVKTLPVSDPTSRLLLWSIAENTFNDSFRCKVGQQVLADDVGVHERTIRRHLNDLCDGDHPVIVCHRVAGIRRANDEIEIVGFQAWFETNRASRRGAGKRAPADGGRPDKLSGRDGSDDGRPDNLGRPDKLSGSRPDTCCPVADRTPGVRYTKEDRTEDLPVLSPPTPQGGEGEGEDRPPVEEDHPLVRELLDEGQPAHVARGFLGALLVDLQPWKHVPSVVATARQLCADLAERRAAVLDLARSQLRKTARYRLPPPADILAAVDAAEAAHDTALEASRRAATDSAQRAAADPVLGQRTAALKAALEARLGAQVCAAWFATLAVESLDDGRLVVSASPQFARSWIASNYEPVLTEAGNAVLGTVRRVDVVAAPAPAAGAAA